MISSDDVSVDLRNDNISNVSFICQKEHIFVTPYSERPIIGTLSVRSCYAITIHHKEKTCLIHWDDNTNRQELDRIMKEFLDDKILLTDCRINIAGGWKTAEESNKTGLFLLNYFSKYPVSRQGFQEKHEEIDLKDPTGTGFSQVLIDAKTGHITLSSDWIKNDWTREGTTTPPKCFGPYFNMRRQAMKYLDTIHEQLDQYKDSGTPLLPPCNDYLATQTKQIKKLSILARDNKIGELIQLLDVSIVDINMPAASNAQGWTALHYACCKGNFKCAEILVSHGADIRIKNDNQKTPLMLMTDTKEKEKLEVLWHTMQQSINKYGDGGLRGFAIYSRHPDRLGSEYRTQVEAVYNQIDDDASRTATIEALKKDDDATKLLVSG